MPRRGLFCIYVGSFNKRRLTLYGLQAPRDVMLWIKTRSDSDYFSMFTGRRWSMIGGDVPINRRYVVLEEIGVGFGKWRTAKESILRSQR